MERRTTGGGLVSDGTANGGRIVVVDHNRLHVMVMVVVLVMERRVSRVAGGIIGRSSRTAACQARKATEQGRMSQSQCGAYGRSVNKGQISREKKAKSH